VAQVFRHTARFEPAAMPAALLTLEGDHQDQREEDELEQGKRPFPVGARKGQVGNPANDGERGEHEVDHHPAAIGVGQAR
jgi:hypothetical protein